MSGRVENNASRSSPSIKVAYDASASVASDEETVRQNITFRYNSVKSRLALMQARLQDINALVKIKNPSLLLQLQRTPPSFPK